MLTRDAVLHECGNGVWLINATDGSIGSVMRAGFAMYAMHLFEAIPLFLSDHPDLRITAMLWEEDNLVLVTELRNPRMVAKRGKAQPAAVLVAKIKNAYQAHTLEESKSVHSSTQSSIQSSIERERALAQAECLLDALAAMIVPPEHLDEVVARLIQVQKDHPVARKKLKDVLACLQPKQLHKRKRRKSAPKPQSFPDSPAPTNEGG